MESQSIQPQATVFSEKKAPQLYTDGRFTSLKTLTEDYTLSDKNNQYLFGYSINVPNLLMGV